MYFNMQIDYFTSSGHNGYDSNQTNTFQYLKP